MVVYVKDTMFKQFNNKKFVEHQGYDFGVLILPVLSISKPSPNPRHGNILTQRIVFDWGKSLSHPNAKIAFGMLTRPGGQFFPYLVIGEIQYTVMDQIQKCRSGRRAAIIHKSGEATVFNLQLIKKALAQEFPQ